MLQRSCFGKDFVVEFIRVQIDKFLLTALLIWLFSHHADDRLVYAVLGGLVMLIQGRRFKT